MKTNNNVTNFHIAYEITRINNQTKHTAVQAQGYKTFSMLNSAEHKIYPANKC